MSNKIELNLNDKLVLREKDEKGKFMIVKQGIRGNKTINENAYRLVYRLIRDFLSGKAFNSKVIYNTETKKLEYGDDLQNPETQRNIQINIYSDAQKNELKYYTQIRGDYSKSNLAILTLESNGTLSVKIYIPEAINTLIDNESIYYAKLITEIRTSPTFNNLFQNVEKNYTFSQNEPEYSVFEKLNDLTHKLENKHFNKLTVEYVDDNGVKDPMYILLYDQIDLPNEKNVKQFQTYLNNRAKAAESAATSSLGFLLNLAITRYDKVHIEFKKQFTSKEEESTSNQQSAPEAENQKSTQPVNVAAPGPETLDGIKNEIKKHLDGLTPDLPTVGVNVYSTKQNLNSLLTKNFQDFKESFINLPIPNISQPSKEHITKLIEKYETLSSKTAEAENQLREYSQAFVGKTLKFDGTNFNNTPNANHIASVMTMDTFYEPKLVDNIFSTDNNLPPFEIYVQRKPSNYDIYIVFNGENAILQKGLSFNNDNFALGEEFILLT